MNIGYCSGNNPYNKASWPGTSHYIIKTLNKHCGNVLPLQLKYHPLKKVLSKISTKKGNSQYLKRNIRDHKLDILFIHANSSSPVYPDQELDIPIIYLAENNPNRHIYNQKNLKESSIVISSSHRITENMLYNYGVKKDKVTTLPLGANLNSPPAKDTVEFYRKINRGICKLLFFGKNWSANGGDIAYRAMLDLNTRGINTELIVCGCYPPPHLTNDKLVIKGFLDKKDSQDADLLDKLYLNSSFFILPLKTAELVTELSKAAAYGLPIISTHKGHTPAYVENNHTGYLLPADSYPIKYADVIQKAWCDKDEYLRLACNSRDKFEKELNYDTWGKRVREIISRIA